MSWLYSRALVEDYSPATYLVGEQSAQLSAIGTPQAYLYNGKMIEYSSLSQFGMTFEHLTRPRGAAVLTSFLVASHVKRLARLLGGEITPSTYGLKCAQLWQVQGLDLSLLKTYPCGPSTPPATILKRWVTRPKQLPCQRQTWVRTMYGKDIGYLHTPTTKANYSAQSMQKHPCARAFVTVFGRPSPTNQEWLMGWPIGWTDLQPLEMDKFRLWLSAHC